MLLGLDRKLIQLLNFNYSLKSNLITFYLIPISNYFFNYFVFPSHQLLQLEKRYSNSWSVQI